MTTTTNGMPPVAGGKPPAQLDEPDSVEAPGFNIDDRELARQEIRRRAAAGLDELSGKRIGMMFGYSERWGRDRIAEVRRSEPVAPAGQDPAATALGAADDAAQPTVGIPQTVAVDEQRSAPDSAPGMPGTLKPPKVAGAWGMYFVALIATVISANTSYRFFGERLNITGLPLTVPALGPLPGFTLDLERVALFGVMEVALIVLAYAMRANVIRIGRPGPAQWVAWGVCGFAAFAAWELSGPVEGTARVILGPVFGLVMLHLALGIEIKVRRGQSTGVWSQAGRELRERALSRLGLGNDERDALARTRDRAALRAARLAVEVSGMAKETEGYGAKVDKLRKALHASNLAHDPQMRDRMLRELATLKHAETLADVEQPSPW